MTYGTKDDLFGYRRHGRPLSLSAALSLCLSLSLSLPLSLSLFRSLSLFLCRSLSRHLVHLTLREQLTILPKFTMNDFTQSSMCVRTQRNAASRFIKIEEASIAAGECIPNKKHRAFTNRLQSMAMLMRTSVRPVPGRTAWKEKMKETRRRAGHESEQRFRNKRREEKTKTVGEGRGGEGG